MYISENEHGILHSGKNTANLDFRLSTQVHTFLVGMKNIDFKAALIFIQETHECRGLL